ncbi:hypothetical protein D4764_01G0001060 [Takifugu flavidus]|uniref:Uncharacterized protein n=1 Tax=Takifugu flavidus TaxID=433684 RepID=A0A5C6PN49_9TELE|nr:hypothetical protein D4764_01G0001060 [Takifugu flavidus]
MSWQDGLSPPKQVPITAEPNVRRSSGLGEVNQWGKNNELQLQLLDVFISTPPFLRSSPPLSCGNTPCRWTLDLLACADALPLLLLLHTSEKEFSLCRFLHLCGSSLLFCGLRREAAQLLARQERPQLQVDGSSGRRKE